MNSYREYWRKMFVFNATATRKQYWSAVIINYIVIGLYAFLSGQWRNFDDYGRFQMNLSIGSLIFGLLLLLVWIANFTIRARRLHDTDRSNWWILITILPLIGSIWFFILLILPSRPSRRWPLNQTEVEN
ncbi:DUF805 domain-containing protein [Agrilactobacillus fermenti]|uniref:DUF805 domain-containing protein n=1 Tax=Agrilactobacillus fermenti TaxID=2586909 RepID=UPI001E61C33E|nr:DUF805 domain-containing protein [Agrilactobacillus fermenti]MCD2257369.1 DUF805 domain-containing protein [Agrilactobacillus fermenti]